MTVEPSHHKSKLSTPSSVSLYDHGDGIFSIQIAAASSKNELSKELVEQLLQALEAAQQESTIKVLTISGMEGCFLHGGRKQNNEAVEQKLYRGIVSFPYPVIAAMQGDAIGAGFLAGALCDFMVCSQEGSYYYTNLQEGLYPTAGEELLLRERFGEARTTDFLYISTTSTGNQLQAKGWTCPILPQEQVAAHAQALASNLAKKSQDSLRLLKQHLSRHLAPLVGELRVADSVTSDSIPGKAKADVAIASPSKQIQVETHPGNVLLIRILESKKAQGIKTLVADLRNIFTQIDNASQYKSIVLASDRPEFIPEAASAGDVLDLQRLILESTIPVIAALDSNANGNGWLISQLCDASVYHDQGAYCAASILQSPELAKQAGMIFSHRFGSHFGKEILLTGHEYSGVELQQRAGTLNTAEKGQVLAKALEIADHWAKLPMETIQSWKKQARLHIQKKMDQQPNWSLAEETENQPLPATPSPVGLKSKVVSAIAHPEGILVVKMEDREAKNMFSDAFIDGMYEVFAHIAQTPVYKAVVLTGYDTYFASGGTKEGLLAIQEGKVKFTDIKIYQLAMECKVPVIAAMQGHGIGAGWCLGMFADLILFSEESRYVSPYMNYGFTPGAGATFIFPYVMGYDLARVTLLTAREYTGSELKERGLLLPVLRRDQVYSTAMALAKQIAKHSRTSLIALKQQLTQHLHSQVEETYKLELSMHDKTFVGQSETLKQINKNFIQEKNHPQVETKSSEMSIGKEITKTTLNVGTLPAVIANVKKFLAEELLMQEQEIDENVQFVDLGLDSIVGVSLIRKINEKYKTSIEATKIYSYSTVSQLGRYVKEEAEKQGEAIITNPAATTVTPIALSSKIQPQNVGALSVVTANVKKFLADELHMQEQEIDENAQFVDLGLDSIVGVSLIRKINEKYKTSIEATKIYSYPTVSQLGRYVKEEAEKLGALVNTPIITEVIPSAVVNKIHSQVNFISKSKVKKLSSWRNQLSSRITPETDSSFKAQPIAVIGMAGKFPEAKNIEEFWQNIAQGKNCISEIPQKRWDINTYYQEGNPKAGKTNSKWMGTLEEYDQFDPLFFTISPIEAESMDPQQRLFLQACYHTIEDAGYNAQKLSGTKCGVFAGCAAGDYQLLSREQQLSAQGFTGGTSSILAARISYFLNLQGPCIAIETACSSSLVAIACACDSLISGGSDVVLAGGVFVMTGPEMHVKTAQSGMLSQDGRCYTFDQRANGFVPGEGVGVVMLKRLADAEKDQDKIYGVIQGWGVNQDGKTNGITAPNPESQMRLEQEVYDKYRIDPASIQLIEAHGTGTKLGDPIEVDALKQSFKKYTQKKDYCALGSVKSNIGHCLTAAGVASFIKVLLSLENKQLPPTVNFENLNEHIDLKDSPFYVNNRLQKWETENTQKRQAAISAFGFSGTNVHMVVAEYIPQINTKESVSAITQNGKIMVPLSARNAVQLKEKAHDLLEFTRKKETSIDLLEIAYTLQVGREAMEERLGFMVSSVDQLVMKLSAYIDGGENIEDVYQGQVKRNKEGLRLLIQDDDMKETMVERWISQKNLTKLLDLWVKGLEFDWNRLYGKTKPERMHLPVYPFAKEQYWIEAVDVIQQPMSMVTGVTVLHPLLHKKIVDLREQGYNSNFSGKEFFLDGHQNNTDDSSGKKIQLINLPTYPFSRDRCWPESATAYLKDSDNKDSMSKNLESIEDIINKIDNESMETNQAVKLIKNVAAHGMK